MVELLIDLNRVGVGWKGVAWFPPMKRGVMFPRLEWRWSPSPLGTPWLITVGKPKCL